MCALTDGRILPMVLVPLNLLVLCRCAYSPPFCRPPPYSPPVYASFASSVCLVLPLQVLTKEEQLELAATPAHPAALTALYMSHSLNCLGEHAWRFLSPALLSLLHQSLLPVACASFIGQVRQPGSTDLYTSFIGQAHQLEWRGTAARFKGLVYQLVGLVYQPHRTGTAGNFRGQVYLLHRTGLPASQDRFRE